MKADGSKSTLEKPPPSKFPNLAAIWYGVAFAVAVFVTAIQAVLCSIVLPRVLTGAVTTYLAPELCFVIGLASFLGGGLMLGQSMVDLCRSESEFRGRIIQPSEHPFEFWFGCLGALFGSLVLLAVAGVLLSASLAAWFSA